jgi:hypothetical protein
MRRRGGTWRGRLVAGIFAVFLVVVSAEPIGAANATLAATVGPGPSVKLQLSNGLRVRRLHAGMFVIVVADKSQRENFHLRGPGAFSKKTAVRFVGRAVWTLKLTAGRYRYFSDRHPSAWKGFIVV